MALSDLPTAPQPEQPGPTPVNYPGFSERPGDTIGPFKLLEVLGEGGFGVVYLAERREPMVQRVALKVIKPGMDSKAVVARFEQERQALAVMDHPNVARVLDGGVTPSGRPYFVMEHVKGEPITDYADRQRLTIKQRLELFIPVCEAVQHAHMKGIIHRDLKPSNILVAPGDAGAPPIVKVIDFGVAKAISHTLTEKTIFTERGQIIGTPEYMSPEQAEMGATDIDTRSDVYSLGVVLYELLSGTLPFDSKSLRAAGYAEIQRIIREVDPPKPSTKLSTADDVTGARIAKARQAERERIASELRAELEWIPLKALRKDRCERYQSSSDLVRDLQNYLDGKPLEAGPESASYRARKFLNKRAKLVAAVWIVFAAVLITQMRQAVQLGSQKEVAAVATDAWCWGMLAIERWLCATQAKLSSQEAESARATYLEIAVPLLRESGRLSGQLAAQNSSSLGWIVSDYYEDASRLAQATDEELRALALSDALDVHSTQFPVRMHDYGKEPNTLVTWSPTPTDRLDANELRRRLEGLVWNLKGLLVPASHYETPHGSSGRAEVRFSDWSASRQLWEATLGDRELARAAFGSADTRRFDSIEMVDVLKIVRGQAVIESSAFPSRLDVLASRKWKVPAACVLITVMSILCWLWPHARIMQVLSIATPVAAGAIAYLVWYSWTYGMLSGGMLLMHMNAAFLLLPSVMTLAMHERWKSVSMVVASALAIFFLAAVVQYVPGSRDLLVAIYKAL